MRRPALCLLAMLLVSVGCVPPAPQKTQLQIREFQTRSYDTKDTRMVMKALLNVLQDDSFIVKNANVDLGLITASLVKGIPEDLTLLVFFSRWCAGPITRASGKARSSHCSSRVRTLGTRRIPRSSPP